MDSKLKEIIDISIKFESNMSKLYTLYGKTFKEDKKFWLKLADEEDGHALLLKSAKDAFGSSEYFPAEMLPKDLDDLTLFNLQLEKTIYNFELNPPSREVAFQTAYKFEVSAGEIHFQKAMNESNPSGFLKIFQELNVDDKDHVKRILEYSEAKGIAATG